MTAWPLLLVLLAGSPAARAEDARHRRLAEQFAPVIFQESRSVKLDQITRFDFDGDWNGANNWDNAYLFPTPAYVYYAVIEADRHWFLYYAFFHPRDYTATPLEGFAPRTEHENDLEGMLLVVEKGLTGEGRVIYMETLAHDKFYKYSEDSRLAVAARSVRLDGRITWYRDPWGAPEPARVAVFVEAQGHGVYDLRARFRGDPGDFPGIIYRPAGRGAEEPRHAGDHNVSYELIPIRDTLWARRTEIGGRQAYCCAESYGLADGRQARFGASLNGPVGGCAAKPPWGWRDARDRDLPAGAWFLDPIRAVAAHVRIPRFSRRYLDNPYFEGQGVESEASGCAESGESQTLRQSTLQTVVDIGQVLLSGGSDRGSVGQQARELFLKDLTLLEWSRQPEMARWQFLDASAKSLAETGGMTASDFRTRLRLGEGTRLQSPLFSAPQRFFRWVVLRYRSDRPLQLSLRWQNEDQQEFPDGQRSPVFDLPAAKDWQVFRADLSAIEGWKEGRTAVRLEIELQPAGDGAEPADLEIQYLVLDRMALADALREKK